MERIVPGRDVLAHWVEKGMTHQEMADEVLRTTGHRVSRGAITMALIRHNLSTTVRPRYNEELPWRVATPHLGAYPARMLRLLGRRNAGVDMSEEQNRRLDSWLAQMDELGVVVGYDPDSEEGFVYIDRHPSDPRNPPIRRRRVWLDPPPRVDHDDGGTEVPAPRGTMSIVSG
jgi:hypothetical protein